MHFFDIQYKQRAFDGKWMKLGKVADHENAYTYIAENKNKVTLVPTKWLILEIYDYELEFVG